MTGMLILFGIIMINVIMGGLITYRQYKIETFRYREENKKFISRDKTPILYESYKSSLGEYFVFAFFGSSTYLMSRSLKLARKSNM